jgi:hypothetical protein
MARQLIDENQFEHLAVLRLAAEKGDGAAFML